MTETQEMNSVVTWTTLIADVVVAVAAILGSIMAYRGLITWREQIRGKSEYECARRLLVTIRHIEHAIGSVLCDDIHPTVVH